MEPYIVHVPALMNLLIAFAAMHALLRLTKMRLDAQKVPKGQDNRRSDDSQPSGVFASFGWLVSQRLPEVVIAGIAIPDIPVLVKLLSE